MKPVKGYYSLIQYCPDLSRLETVNIGVLLFCPEIHFLKARTDESDARVRRLFAPKANERGRITALKKAIEERLTIEQQHFQTLEDLQHFINTRANAIQLTVPRPMKVYEPEDDLRRLFEQLVKTESNKTDEGAPHKRVTKPVRQVLNKAFSDRSVAPFVRKSITVEVPAFQRTVKVPFGYQNGHFNLIQPVRFDNKGEEGAYKEASFHALEGQSLADYRHPKYGELQLTVVGQFSPEQRDTKDVVQNLLNEHDVRLFTLDELDKLIQEILATGKPVSRNLR